MTNKKKFIIGSRGSKLSLAYAGYVKDLLLKNNLKIEYGLLRSTVTNMEI